MEVNILLKRPKKKLLVFYGSINQKIYSEIVFLSFFELTIASEKSILSNVPEKSFGNTIV